MARYIKIENDEDYQWLLLILENQLHKFKDGNSKLPIETIVQVERILEDLKIEVDLQSASSSKLDSAAKAETIKSPAKSKTASEKPSLNKRTRRSKEEMQMVRSQAKCNTHVTYTASRAPRTDCDECWKAYKKFHPLEYNRAKERFQRNQRLQEKEH